MTTSIMQVRMVALAAGLALFAGCAQTKEAPAGAAGAGTSAPPAEPAQPVAQAFDRTLELQGITFHVTSPNTGAGNQVTVQPAGLEGDNAPVSRAVDGIVTGAEVADLNVDGSPEVYVYVQNVGSGSYGSLAAWAVNGRKSLSEIYLPPLTDNAEAAPGYMGHDEFAVVENSLVQRFPVYREGDSNANPTGGTRQVQYKLTPGEAGWVLKADKVVSY